jgi:hypothetical protein
VSRVRHAYHEDGHVQSGSCPPIRQTANPRSPTRRVRSPGVSSVLLMRGERTEMWNPRRAPVSGARRRGGADSRRRSGSCYGVGP